MSFPRNASAAIAAMAPIVAFAQSSQPANGWRDWAPGPWHMMWGMGGGFWWIFPLLMIAAMVLCAWVMMRVFGAHSSGHAEDTSALRILNERFARGEIPKDEFEDKRAVLRRGT